MAWHRCFYTADESVPVAGKGLQPPLPPVQPSSHPPCAYTLRAKHAKWKPKWKPTWKSGATIRIENASDCISSEAKNLRWSEASLLEKDSKIRKAFSKNSAFIANVLKIVTFIEAVLNIGKKADIALPVSQRVHSAFYSSVSWSISPHVHNLP